MARSSVASGKTIVFLRVFAFETILLMSSEGNIHAYLLMINLALFDVCTLCGEKIRKSRNES